MKPTFSELLTRRIDAEDAIDIAHGIGASDAIRRRVEIELEDGQQPSVHLCYKIGIFDGGGSRVWVVWWPTNRFDTPFFLEDETGSIVSLNMVEPIRKAFLDRIEDAYNSPDERDTLEIERG